jgi:hypothetical protein
MPSRQAAVDFDGSNGVVAVAHDTSQRPGEHDHEFLDDTLMHDLTDWLVPPSAPYAVAPPNTTVSANSNCGYPTSGTGQELDAAIASLLMLVGEADSGKTDEERGGSPCFQHYEGLVDTAVESLLLGEDVPPVVVAALGAAEEHGAGEYFVPHSGSGDGAKAAPAAMCSSVHSSHAAASRGCGTNNVSATGAATAHAAAGLRKRRRGRGANMTPRQTAHGAKRSRSGLPTVKTGMVLLPQRRGQRIVLERPAQAHYVTACTIQRDPAAVSVDGSATAEPPASRLGAAVVTTCRTRSRIGSSRSGCLRPKRADATSCPRSKAQSRVSCRHDAGVEPKRQPVSTSTRSSDDCSPCDSPPVSNHPNDSDAQGPSPRMETDSASNHTGDALTSQEWTPSKPPKNGKQVCNPHQPRQEPRTQKTVGEVRVKARTRLKTAFQPNCKPNLVKSQRKKQDNLFRLCCYMIHFRGWTVAKATLAFNYCPHEPSVVRRYVQWLVAAAAAWRFLHD